MIYKADVTHYLMNFLNEVITFAVYVYSSVLSKYFVLCEGAEDLPSIMEFRDLHLTENYLNAIEDSQAGT